MHEPSTQPRLQATATLSGTRRSTAFTAPALLVGLFAASCNSAAPTQRLSDLPPITAHQAVVEFPADYRTEYHNYLSLDRVQNHDQIIRLFANDIAMRGPGEDGKLPFGSIIVGEVYKAKKDANGRVRQSSLGRRLRDKLALVAVMERGEHLGTDLPEELKNGHWDFGAFTPAGLDAGKDLNDCRSCHAPLVETNHLFSFEHLR